MQVKQLYTNCLAQGAYYISHNGEAAIIDPLRETRPYVDMLQQNGDRLKYIFETHFHADFVSGHVDLARKTGAKIVFGPSAETGYESIVAKDGQTFKIGDLTIRVLHTPGHTLESSCYLLEDMQGQAVSIFTGDTLFIGDVGRPDLAIASDLTERDLAGMLYESLRSKIMPLPDHITVYPGHGAGSACGKNMSKETFDTLGNQKKVNYALQQVKRDVFIDQLIDGILPPPYYFAQNAALNKKGYLDHEEVLKRGTTPLSADIVENIMKTSNTLILDVRKPAEFAEGHVPGSLFIGLDGQFAPWVGTMITDIHQPIVVVAPDGREEEAVMRLSRVGYDNCIGFLRGGAREWEQSGKRLSKIESIPAAEFVSRYKKGVTTIDVRKPGEFESGHLRRAEGKPLDFISHWGPELSLHGPAYIHCAGGYRSMIAISALMQKGHRDLIDVQGGFGAISKVDDVSKEIVSGPVMA